MKILIDADGCPVVKQTIQISEKKNIRCIIISDTSHTFSSDYAEIFTVDKGADSVDFKLVNMIEHKDVVITQDYGLAAMSLAKGAIVLNQNGMIYDDYNISGLLESRHTAKKIRNSGGRLKGPTKRTPEQDAEFIKTLNKVLECLLNC